METKNSNLKVGQTTYKKQNFMSNILNFRNMKKYGLIFSVFALISLLSCSEADSSEVGNVELSDIDAPSVQKRVWEGERVYMSVSYNEDNKEAVLRELIEGFSEYLYVDLEFDSQEEVAFIELENHLKDSQYVLKYDFMSIVDVVFTLSITATDYEFLEPNKEQLELHCNGGTNDGKSIKVDKPTSKFSSATKQIYEFAMACVDGGGCVDMCTASVAITSVVPKTSDPSITE